MLVTVRRLGIRLRPLFYAICPRANRPRVSGRSNRLPLSATSIHPMKTRSILPLYRSALAGAAILLLIAAPGRAHAGFLLAISQTGGNVVVNGSGTINTTALTLVSNPGQVGPQINSPYAVLVAGSQASTTQYGGLTGPANFGGSGGSNNVSAGSATGTLVGILGAASYLDLSQNYVSGSTISAWVHPGHLHLHLGHGRERRLADGHQRARAVHLGAAGPGGRRAGPDLARPTPPHRSCVGCRLRPNVPLLTPAKVLSPARFRSFQVGVLTDKGE